MLSDVKSTSEEAEEVIRFLPSSELLGVSAYKERQLGQLYKALALYTAPLNVPLLSAASAAGSKKRKREQNEAELLSLHGSQAAWCMHFFKRYFAYVVDMLLSRQYDSSQVLLNRDKIYSVSFDERGAQMHPEFVRDAKAWWRDPGAPTLFLFPIYIVSDMGDHALFAALKKKYRDNQIQVAYIDSGGSEHVKMTGAGTAFIQALQSELFTLTVVPVDFYCPELQTVEQGGNCVQWQMMFLTLLTLHPDGFDNMSRFIGALSGEPLLNLLFFELYMFYYITSVNPEYYKELFNIGNLITPVDTDEFVTADSVLRDKLFPVLPVEECYYIRDEGKCAITVNCIFHKGVCVNKYHVKKTSLMRPKTMYKEVVKLGKNFIQ